MGQSTQQQSIKPVAKLGRAQQQNFYHQHAEICQKQQLYKVYIQSLKVAQHMPESLHAKRKRVCAEFMKLEAPAAMPGTCGTDTQLAMGMGPEHPTHDIVVELVQDLEAMADFKYNFIMRDIAKLGQRRKRRKTEHFHDLKF